MPIFNKVNILVRFFRFFFVFWGVPHNTCTLSKERIGIKTIIYEINYGVLGELGSLSTGRALKKTKKKRKKTKEKII